MGYERCKEMKEDADKLEQRYERGDEAVNTVWKDVGRH